DHAQREHLVQCVDVRRQTGHDAPDRIFVVIGDFLPLELCKDLGPEIEHHPLPDIVEKDLLSVREYEPKEEDSEKCESEKPDAVRSSWRYKAVDRNFCEERLRAVKDICEQREHERSCRHRPIRPQITHQASSNPKVVGLPDLVFLVILLCSVRHGKL